MPEMSEGGSWVPTPTKCANESCREAFEHESAGNVFLVASDSPHAWGLQRSNVSCVLWLCPQCATHLTFQVDDEQQVRMVQRTQESELVQG